MQTPDDKDMEILAARMEQRRQNFTKPTVGDWLRDTTGAYRQISHVWELEDGDQYQTTKGGSFYLCTNGYCSYSGSLYLSEPAALVTPTTETRPALVWFFHHDYHTAHNGVTVQVSFPVFVLDKRFNQS